jgi:ribosomal protein L31
MYISLNICHEAWPFYKGYRDVAPRAVELKSFENIIAW